MDQAASLPKSSALFSFSSGIFKFVFPLAVLCLPLYLGAVNLWSFSAPVLILTLAFYFYWISLQGSGQQTVIGTRLDPAIALYLVFFLIACSRSQSPSKALPEIFKTCAIIVVFYATIYYCRERKRIRGLVVLLVLFGGALSLFGLLQLLGALPKGWWHKPNYISSVYVNHNHFAGLLEMILPLSIAMIILEEDPSKKILWIFVSGLMGAAFILSLSRGGFLAMGLGLSFMLVLLMARQTIRRTFWVFLVLALVVFGAIVLFGVDPFLERLGSLKNINSQEDLSIDQRWLIWKGSLEMILKHVFFGTGPGTFECAFLRFRPQGFIDRPGFAHNDYLQLFADCGAWVFLVTLGLCLTLFYKGLRIVKKHQSVFTIAIGSGCLAGIVSLAAHSFVDFNFHIPANWVFFSVISGILIALGRPKDYSAPVLRIAMRIFISAVCLATLVGGVFFGVSDWFLWKGKQEFRNGRLKNAYIYLDRSIRINPFNAEPYYLKILMANTVDDDALATMPAADKETLKEGIKRAIHLNSYEPYFDYNLAKIHQRSPEARDPLKILPYYQEVVRKDPKDPFLHFLSAVDLLQINKSAKNKAVESEAKSMLKTSIHLNSSNALSIYQALWRYKEDIRFIQDFNRTAPEGLRGFLEFLEKTDLWKYYRQYHLESFGIDPEEKYQMSKTIQWNPDPVMSYSLKEFTAQGDAVFLRDECIYANGYLEKKISFEKPIYRMEIEAKASRAGNSYPYILVLLDGRVIDALYLDSPQFIHFFSVFKTSPGNHVIGIDYINDHADSVTKEDRNIWIKNIQLYGTEG